MAKLGKDKIALFLACASVLGGKTQAMNINKVQSLQTIGTVGGATTPVKNKGLSKKQKIGIAAAITLPVVAAAVGFTIYGVKKHSAKKDNDSNKNNNNNLNKSQKNIDNSKISENEIYEVDFNEEYEGENNKEEENISNSIRMFKALDKIDIDEKGNKEENNKEKELMVGAFKYFVGELKEKTVEGLLTSDIFYEFCNNNGDKIESVENIKEYNSDIVQGLLDIFSDKSKISDINVKFVPKDEGLNAHDIVVIEFSYNNEERTIVLSDFVGVEQINIKYLDGKNSKNQINFRVPYNVINNLK